MNRTPAELEALAVAIESECPGPGLPHIEPPVLGSTGVTPAAPTECKFTAAAEVIRATAQAAGLAPFVVHVAAAPVQTGTPPSSQQRCVICGFVLIDNTAWLTGDVAVPEADAGQGPSWYPVSARIGTDKTDSRSGGMTYVVTAERPLLAEERHCTT